MWGAAIIVFREVFEIAIILCVVLAATQGIKGRGKWINLGILCGALGACAFAGITEYVALLVGNAGKHYFNAAVLTAAVLMIGWTVIWMKHHSKTIVGQIKQVGKDIVNGEKPLHILSVVIALAVMREGSEIVVFLYGMLASGDVTWPSLLFGSIIGVALGAVFGLFLYYGLLKISIKHTFQMTSVLLTLIAAGMAANAAGKLVSAGLLPALITQVWDSSFILSQHSLLGRFLFILVGYQDKPSGVQMLCYLATIAVIYLLAKRQSSERAI